MPQSRSSLAITHNPVKIPGRGARAGNIIRGDQDGTDLIAANRNRRPVFNSAAEICLPTSSFWVSLTT